MVCLSVGSHYLAPALKGIGQPSLAHDLDGFGFWADDGQAFPDMV